MAVVVLKHVSKHCIVAILLLFGQIVLEVGDIAEKLKSMFFGDELPSIKSIHIVMGLVEMKMFRL